jgi:hypothetical protein
MRLLADAGLTAYRFSVEWARIQPEPDLFSRAAIDHYRRMVDSAHQLGLEPSLTLHHITHPAWFSRGRLIPGAGEPKARAGKGARACVSAETGHLRKGYRWTMARRSQAPPRPRNRPAPRAASRTSTRA